MKNIIGWLLLLAAGGFYWLGIGCAIYRSWTNSLPAIHNSHTISTQANDTAQTTRGASIANKRSATAHENLSIPAPLESFTTAIGAILLANFGAALGIALQQRQSATARMLGLFRASPERSIPPPASLLEKIQQVAVFVFLVALIACLVTWINDDFSTDPKQIVPLVYQVANTFFGILTAYVASLLSPPAR